LPCPAGRSVPGRGGPERRRLRDRTGPEPALGRWCWSVLGPHGIGKWWSSAGTSGHVPRMRIARRTAFTAWTSDSEAWWGRVRAPPAQRSQAGTRWVHAEPTGTGVQRARAVTTGTQESQASDVTQPEQQRSRRRAGVRVFRPTHGYREPSGLLPTRQVVTKAGPHPAGGVGASPWRYRPRQGSPAMPTTCPSTGSEGSAMVKTGRHERPTSWTGNRRPCLAQRPGRAFQARDRGPIPTGGSRTRAGTGGRPTKAWFADRSRLGP
jgi:hypothetical protein